jgi:ATP-dependent Clp protease ATP-binding subunit ClpA
VGEEKRMTFIATSRGEPIGRWEPAHLDHQFYTVWGPFVPAPAFDPLRPVFEAAPNGLWLSDLFEEVVTDAGDDVDEGYQAFCRARDALRLALRTPTAAVAGARIVGITRSAGQAGQAGQDAWELLVRTEGAAAFERIARLHYLHAPETFARFAHRWTTRAVREEPTAEHARVQRAADVLARARRNNPVFIGPAGTVRDQLVADTVGMLLAGGIEVLAGWHVAALDVEALCALKTWDKAGETLQAVAWHAYHASPRTLFVIDRIDELLPQMAATLKPLLGRQQIRFIGTATLEDYRAKIETDPVVQRCVQEILAS